MWVLCSPHWDLSFHCLHILEEHHFAISRWPLRRLRPHLTISLLTLVTDASSDWCARTVRILAVNKVSVHLLLTKRESRWQRFSESVGSVLSGLRCGLRAGQANRVRIRVRSYPCRTLIQSSHPRPFCGVAATQKKERKASKGLERTDSGRSTPGEIVQAKPTVCCRSSAHERRFGVTGIGLRQSLVSIRYKLLLSNPAALT